MASVSRAIFYTVIILLVVPVAFLATVTISVSFKPFRRGFFCDDESIQLPYLVPTVSPFELEFFGLSITLLLILCGEYIYHIKKHEIVQFYHSAFRKVIRFGSGFVFQYYLVEMGKLTVGRLRPNFIAVCGINMDQICGNNTHRYILNFTCPNSPDLSDESRKSFPSGHAATSFYFAVFIVLYLQKRLNFGTLFWKPLIQFLFVLLAWWISLTRIMDNYHHFSDVIVGILIGSGVAILNPILVDSSVEDINVDHYTIRIKDDFSSQEAASEKSHLLQGGKISDVLCSYSFTQK